MGLQALRANFYPSPAGVEYAFADRSGGVRFGRKPLLLPQTVEQIRLLRETGETVPTIMRQTGLSKASVYRALDAGWLKAAY